MLYSFDNGSGLTHSRGEKLGHLLREMMLKVRTPYAFLSMDITTVDQDTKLLRMV